MSTYNMVLATSSSRRPAVLATSMRSNGGPENSASYTFKGVHQRTWGKWVAEIRDPNLGFRIWLGTFSTSIQAAVAYDTAALKLYGPSAELNLPGYFREEENQPKDNPDVIPLERNVNNNWYWDGDFDDSELWETAFKRDVGGYIYGMNEQEEEEVLVDEMNKLACS